MGVGIRRESDGVELGGLVGVNADVSFDKNTMGDIKDFLVS